MKTWCVHYYSRYYKFDVRKKYLYARTKKEIRDNWHDIMLTDEFIIKKITEVQR